MWPMAGTGSSVTASSSLPSASGSEKHATSPASARTPPAQLKPRSCVTCRRRKVKCDKLVPRCSTCTRAQIACVYPSPDRPPRWARSLAASNTQAPQFMDRVRNLESLVTELRAQLEQANATHSSAGDELAVPNSPRASTLERGAEQQRDRLLPTNTENAEKHFGRLVFQDTSRSRYISSAFWSRVSDEIDGLKKDARGLANDESDSSVEEASPGKSPSTMELERTPSERHAFLFRHNLSPSVHELGEFQPLPSQIPFLLDVFAENVNLMSQIVHIPTVNRLVRDSRGSNMHFTPANEALMFSIYYAAITSMDEDDVMTNFGSSRTDLNLKYRLGLEHALAKADFLNQPDIVLVQALVIFVSLARRHESPRWVYMLTGIAIRMAQYVGLQRDGTNFQHLTPFQTEMRRRVWWALCTLDQRASEDQGTDLTITSGSFDTKIPLNINDADINPETRVMPVERDGVTDMTFARMTVGLTDIQRQIMAPGFGDGPAGLEDQSRLLNQIYQKYEHGYFQKTTKAENIAHLVGVTIVRLVLAKMTLVVFLPVLFSTPSEHFSDEIRAKLLVSAIEVAEYNHALNSEPACRQWRWIYQTYTHWHAIVYLLIEVARRPWSPTVERAWVALHSSWLIPAQTSMQKNLRIWIPLRRLMSKARKHRDAELDRLRVDPRAVARLAVEDRKIPLPSSSGSLLNGSGIDTSRERWCQLVGMSEETAETSGNVGAEPARTCTSQPTAMSDSPHHPGELSTNLTFESTSLGASGGQTCKIHESPGIRDPEPASLMNTPSDLALGQTAGLSFNQFPEAPTDWSDGRAMGPGCVSWLWADSDPSIDVFTNLDVDSSDINMDLDGDVNWYDWVESAQSLA